MLLRHARERVPELLPVFDARIAGPSDYTSVREALALIADPSFQPSLDAWLRVHASTAQYALLFRDANVERGVVVDDADPDMNTVVTTSLVPAPRSKEASDTGDEHDDEGVDGGADDDEAVDADEGVDDGEGVDADIGVDDGEGVDADIGVDDGEGVADDDDEGVADDEGEDEDEDEDEVEGGSASAEGE